MESLYFLPPINRSTSYVCCDVIKLSMEIKLIGGATFDDFKVLEGTYLWTLFYIHKFKSSFSVTWYIFLSANQHRLYSVTTIVLPTVTARNLPAILK
jgi:hypothetical protein